MNTHNLRHSAKALPPPKGGGGSWSGGGLEGAYPLCRPPLLAPLPHGSRE